MNIHTHTHWVYADLRLLCTYIYIRDIFTCKHVLMYVCRILKHSSIKCEYSPKKKSLVNTGVRKLCTCTYKNDIFIIIREYVCLCWCMLYVICSIHTSIRQICIYMYMCVYDIFTPIWCIYTYTMYIGVYRSIYDVYRCNIFTPIWCIWCMYAYPETDKWNESTISNIKKCKR